METAMAGRRIVVPNYMPALDLNGDPVAGAKLYFYDNLTTDLASIYTTAALTVAHPNPVTADAAGVFPSIFADDALIFSVAITDAAGQPIGGLRNRDAVKSNVLPVLTTGTIQVEAVSSAQAMSIGAQTFIQTAGFAASGDGGGALYKRVASEPTHGGKFQSADLGWWELTEPKPNVKMFGAKGDDSTNDTNAIAAALSYAALLVRTNSNISSQESGGVTVDVPAGIFKITDTLVIVNGVYLRGAGKTATIIKNTTNGNTLVRNDNGDVYNAFGGGVLDLTLSGNRAGTGQIGLDLLRPMEMFVGRVYIENMGSHGMRIRQGLLSLYEHVTVAHCVGHGVITGEGVLSWDNPVTDANHYPTMAQHFLSCHFLRNDGAGVCIGPYTNACFFSGGGSEYNYNAAGNNVGYNVELRNTGSFMANTFENFGVEGPVEAHIVQDAPFSTNRIVRLNHYSNGASGNVDRAVINLGGILHLDSPEGQEASYKSIGGNITPFRLDKTGPAIIHLTNPQGSTLTRDSVWVEDETGATTGLTNNLYQYASGVTRGAPPKVWTAFNVAGPEFLREGDTQPYVRLNPFYRDISFGSGSAAPDVGLARLGTRTLGLGSYGDGQLFQLGGAWNGNHALMGNSHLWVDGTGDLRIKGSAPSSDTDGVVVGTQT